MILWLCRSALRLRVVPVNAAAAAAAAATLFGEMSLRHLQIALLRPVIFFGTVIELFYTHVSLNI